VHAEVDGAHAALAEELDDREVAELLARGELGHG